MRFLRHRIADERVLRLISKWLAAGVVEDGKLSETQQGSPQGASLSPLLANVYLHYVLDLWADWWWSGMRAGRDHRAFRRTISSSGSSTGTTLRTPGGAGQRFAESAWSSPGEDPADRFGRYAVPQEEGPGRGEAGRSRFWDSRTSARSPGGDGSGYGGSPTGNGCGQS